jgi:hypothetical protein
MGGGFQCQYGKGEVAALSNRPPVYRYMSYQLLSNGSMCRYSTNSKLSNWFVAGEGKSLSVVEVAPEHNRVVAWDLDSLLSIVARTKEFVDMVPARHPASRTRIVKRLRMHRT